MKMKKLSLCMSILWVACAACSEDDLPAKGGGIEEGMASVEFKTNTFLPESPVLSRSFAPEISKANFRILAFKKNSDGAYVYTQDVPTENMQLADNVLSGRAVLPTGEYKFVPTYGAVRTPAFSWPELAAQTTLLADTLGFAHAKVDGTSVMFLETRRFSDLPSYAVGLTDATTDDVYSTVKRAVARVDLLLIHVKKNADGSYTEVSRGTDVFGGSLPKAVEMQFRDLNRTISLTGENTIGGNTFSTFDAVYTVEDLPHAITIGKGPATLLGTEEFTNYDYVTPADLRKGAAHVQGAYVLPYPQGILQTALTIVLTNASGKQRTIAVPEKLPLERNKVTLVKIYLLSDDGSGDGGGNGDGGGDGGEEIFDANVHFVVTVDTHWDGYQVVEK